MSRVECAQESPLWTKFRNIIAFMNAPAACNIEMFPTLLLLAQRPTSHIQGSTRHLHLLRLRGGNLIPWIITLIDLPLYPTIDHDVSVLFSEPRQSRQVLSNRFSASQVSLRQRIAQYLQADAPCIPSIFTEPHLCQDVTGTPLYVKINVHMLLALSSAPSWTNCPCQTIERHPTSSAMLARPYTLLRCAGAHRTLTAGVPALHTPSPLNRDCHIASRLYLAAWRAAPHRRAPANSYGARLVLHSHSQYPCHHGSFSITTPPDRAKTTVVVLRVVQHQFALLVPTVHIARLWSMYPPS